MGNCFEKSRIISGYKDELVSTKKMISLYDLHLDNWITNSAVFNYLRTKYSQREMKPFESRISLLILRNDKLLDDLKTMLDNNNNNNSEPVIRIGALVEICELQNEDEDNKIVVLGKGSTISKIRRSSYVKYTDWFKNNLNNKKRRLSQSEDVSVADSFPHNSTFMNRSSEAIDRYTLSHSNNIHETENIVTRRSENIVSANSNMIMIGNADELINIETSEFYDL